VVPLKRWPWNGLLGFWFHAFTIHSTYIDLMPLFSYVWMELFWKPIECWDYYNWWPDLSGPTKTGYISPHLTSITLNLSLYFSDENFKNLVYGWFFIIVHSLIIDFAYSFVRLSLNNFKDNSKPIYLTSFLVTISYPYNYLIPFLIIIFYP
jgi:hypothetical protein